MAWPRTAIPRSRSTPTPLTSLERDGLVSRKAIATVPVTVEYAITPLGKTLAKPMDALRIWAETHMDEVLANQQRYDAAERTRR